MWPVWPKVSSSGGPAAALMGTLAGRRPKVPISEGAESVQVGSEPDQGSRNRSAGRANGADPGRKTMGGGRVVGLRPEESLGVGGRTWLKVERWLGPAFEPKVYERGPSQINIGCQAIAFFWLSATPKAERPAPRCVQPKAGWLVAGCWYVTPARSGAKKSSRH